MILAVQASMTWPDACTTVGVVASLTAGGRHIIVDHTGELEPLRVAALELWRATDGPDPAPGPAVGFTTERRWSAHVAPLGYSAYDNGQPPAPVTATVRHGGDGTQEGP